MYLARLRHILIFTGVFSAIQFASMPAHAWAIPKSITTLEWDAWPRICQGEHRLRSKIPMPKNRIPPRLSKKEIDWTTQLGVWHFCTGYIYLFRAQATPVQKKRDRYLSDEVMGDLNWVFKRIGPGHPLAPLVNSNYARALRLTGNHDRAIKILDDLRKHHPKHPEIYLVYTSIHFDRKQYKEAIDVLTSGNDATDDQVPEIQYFLGLAHFKAGNIEQARIYEKKAREGNYPFTFLSRKLREHDAKAARTEQ